MIVGIFFAVSDDGDDEVVDHETPCEEQAPPECLRETIEQAMDSQFVHYCYCACMTTEGLGKGYVASRGLSQKVGGRSVTPWESLSGR